MTQAPLSKSKLILLALIVAIVGILLIGWFAGGSDTLDGPGGADSPDGPLVLYCAHDSVYAQDVIDHFTRKTGIDVSVRYDSEATKSLGLTELLIREKDNPRADVFWNNQFAGTLDLHQRGLLQPYQGPGFARIPEQFKEAGGHFTGFGGRLRVYIVNTTKLEPTPEAVQKALEGDLSRIAIAKPLFGTTLTHLSALWQLWGGDRVKAWHEDWVRRGVQVKGGNATTKNLVASGVCDVGWTDTDDFFVALDQGKPVAMLPIELDNGQVLLIPNTVAIIKGTRRQAQAQQLVDFLLSEECELMLARSAARQIPLGPVNPEDLPEQVRALQPLVERGFPLADIGPSRSACLEWLKAEYIE